MAIKRPGKPQDVESFAKAGKLKISKSEIERRIAAGETLYREESQFNDPGDDWTALYLGTEQIGYWSGY